MKGFKILGVAAALAASLLAGCGSDSDIVQIQPAAAQQGVNFVQVEFLARPVINEGLITDNALLNAFNSVTPAFVRAALGNPNGPEAVAAGPILADATATLNALLGLSNGTGPFQGAVGTPAGGTPDAAFFAGVFLPDVMRIDTTLNIAANAPSFASLATVDGRTTPVGGRKITDDVMDVVTTSLTNNGAAIDNVGYARSGAAPNENAGTGHSPPSATFPYLAEAN